MLSAPTTSFFGSRAYGVMYHMRHWPCASQRTDPNACAPGMTGFSRFIAGSPSARRRKSESSTSSGSTSAKFFLRSMHTCYRGRSRHVVAGPEAGLVGVRHQRFLQELHVSIEHHEIPPAVVARSIYRRGIGL